MATATPTRAVVVAVVAVRVVQVAADDVVDVVAVLDGLVAAVRAVLVLGVVVLAVVSGPCTARGLFSLTGIVGLPPCGLLQATMCISWLVLLSRRPPSSVTVTMSSMRTPKRPGR